MSTKTPEAPIDYYHGLSLEDRIVSRNVVFFERRSEEKLRKKSLRSRLHHRYVLIRVAKTSGSINIDGFNFDLAEGDVVLISPFQFHHYSFLKSPDLHWQFITFELTQGTDRLRQMSSPVQALGKAETSLWEEFIDTWQSEDEATRLESLPVLDRLMMRLCFAGSQDANSPHLRREGSPWIPQAESLIIQSIRDGKNLEDVARQLNVSDRQFRARFKAALDISPKDYRTRYQLHSAISLMQNEQLKLSAIAEMAGFNSQPAFTRFIKKLTELSPKELRQQVRQGAFRMKI